MKAWANATGPRTEEGKAATAANLEGHPTKEEAQRTHFSSFIEQIVVTDDGVKIEYRADRLVNASGFDTVRGKTMWLPDQVSLRTAKIDISFPERFVKKAA